MFALGVGALAYASRGSSLAFHPEAGIAWMLFLGLLLLLVPAPLIASRFGDRAEVALVVAFCAFLILTPAVGKPFDPVSFVVAGLVLGFALRSRSRGLGAASFLYAFSPILMAAFVYANLRKLAPVDESWDLDSKLATIDSRMFGPHWTVAAEAAPWWLNDWFAIFYLGYLAFIVVAALVPWLAGRRAEFDDYALAFCLAMYAAFAFYLAVPAKGPYVALADVYAGPLPGGPLTRLNAAIVGRYHYVHDTFPSMHTANSLMALWSLWRAGSRRLFAFFVFAEVNLLASTIFLRMHYTIDLIAGALLAAAIVCLCPHLNRLTRAAEGRGAGERGWLLR